MLETFDGIDTAYAATPGSIPGWYDYWGSVWRRHNNVAKNDGTQPPVSANRWGLLILAQGSSGVARRGSFRLRFVYNGSIFPTVLLKWNYALGVYGHGVGLRLYFNNAGTPKWNIDALSLNNDRSTTVADPGAVSNKVYGGTEIIPEIGQEYEVKWTITAHPTEPGGFPDHIEIEWFKVSTPEVNQTLSCDIIYGWFDSDESGHSGFSGNGTDFVTLFEGPNAGATPGVASLTANDSTGITVTTTQPYAGVEYQWHRSEIINFTPSNSTVLSGATTQTYKDSGGVQGTTYYYKCTYDGALISNQLVARRKSKNLSFGFIGSSTFASIPAGGTGTPPVRMGLFLQHLVGERTVTITNVSVGGTIIENFDGANLPAHIATFQAADCTDIFLMIGSNNATSGHSADYFIGRLTQMVIDLKSAGFERIWIQYIGYRNDVPSANALIQQYNIRSESIPDAMILNRSYWDLTAANHSTIYYDGIHPNAEGVDFLALLMAVEYAKYLGLGGSSKISNLSQLEHL